MPPPVGRGPRVQTRASPTCSATRARPGCGEIVALPGRAEPLRVGVSHRRHQTGRRPAVAPEVGKDGGGCHQQAAEPPSREAEAEIGGAGITADGQVGTDAGRLERESFSRRRALAGTASGRLQVGADAVAVGDDGVGLQIVPDAVSTPRARPFSPDGGDGRPVQELDPASTAAASRVVGTASSPPSG